MRLRALLSAFVLLLWIGCARRYSIQAPFDSFVCFNATFDECVGHSQNGGVNSMRSIGDQGLAEAKALQDSQLDAYRTGVTAVARPAKHRTGAHPDPRKLAESSVQPTGTDATVQPKASGIVVTDGILKDNDRNAIRSTSDNKYSCSYGDIKYVQSLDPHRQHLAVFVSPVLLRQLDEEVLRFGQARLGCDRLIEDYETQLKISAEEDLLAKYQYGVVHLTADVEESRVSREPQMGVKTGGPTFNDKWFSVEEAATFGIDDSVQFTTALHESRWNVNDANEALRAIKRSQAMDVDFKVRFAEVNMLIDLQAREIARTLFLLDRSIISRQAYRSETAHSDYLSGSWVKQGTVVLKAKASAQSSATENQP